MLIIYGKLFGLALIPAGIALALIVYQKYSSFGKIKPIYQNIIIGLIYGLIAIFGTEYGVNINNKAMANVRDAAPLVAGLVFGGPAGIIAGIIGGVERYFAVYWGVGQYTRIACTVSTILCGFYTALIKKYLFKDKIPLPIFGFIAGVVIETFHMTMVIFTHIKDSDVAFEILNLISFSMIISTGFSVFLTIFLIKKIFIKDENKYQSFKNIYTKIQIYIIYTMTTALIITSLLTFLLQTKEGEKLAEEKLKSNFILLESEYKYSNDKTDFLNMVDTINVSGEKNNIEGMVAVFDENQILLSGKVENLGKTPAELGLDDDFFDNELNKVFKANFQGKEFYYMQRMHLGYHIFNLIPFTKIFTARNNNFLYNNFMQILIYALIFVTLYYIINKSVVNKIYNINKNLHKITNGDLDVKINETDTKEFAFLSNEINQTVDSMKHLMEEEKNRMQKDLTFAKKIQSSSLPSLFPAFPSISQFDIYATMRTAKEVGGDFYDFYFNDKNTLTFLIADVSGKGVPAAMFMMRAKTTIKNLSSAGYDIAEVAIKANNELCNGNDAGMFVTAFIAQLNINNGHIEYVNCGHNPPILIKNGVAKYIDSKKDFVLAGIDDFPYQKQSLDINSGDKLYLYTDGVTEAMNNKSELYSESRLLNYFNDNLASKNIYDSLKMIQQDIDVFATGAEQADDITMLEIIYNGGNENGN